MEIQFRSRYAKDKNYVFYEGNIILHAQSGSFKILKNDYAKDKNHVFFRQYIVIQANPDSFQLLGFPYSKDNNAVYCGTLPIPAAQPESFRVTKKSDGFIIAETKGFLRQYPEYNFIDMLKYPYVVYGLGEAESKNEKFRGFKVGSKN